MYPVDGVFQYSTVIQYARGEGGAEGLYILRGSEENKKRFFDFGVVEVAPWLAAIVPARRADRSLVRPRQIWHHRLGFLCLTASMEWFAYVAWNALNYF